MLILLLAMVFVDVDDSLRSLMKNERVACLSTNYKDTPFGSTVPFALDSKGIPIVVLSSLAIHSKNLDKNDKCSLMVMKEDKEDPFNSKRVTFLGKMVKISDEKQIEQLKKIFVERHKSAKEFIDFGDFSFFKMEIDKIYYVGGFGDINWIEVKEYMEWEIK